jgi:hypothetical protein
MVDRTTMANRSHPAGLLQSSTLQQRLGIQTCTRCTCTIFRRHHTAIFQAQQIYQALHTAEDLLITANILRPTGKQPLCPQKLRPNSDLLCKDGTTTVLTYKTMNWWNNKRLQPTVFLNNYIHWSGRSSKSRRATAVVNTSLLSNSIWFICNSALYKTGCFSRTHQISSCWATTTDSITTWVLLDPKTRNLMKAIIISA